MRLIDERVAGRIRCCQGHEVEEQSRLLPHGQRRKLRPSHPLQLIENCTAALIRGFKSLGGHSVLKGNHPQTLSILKTWLTVVQHHNGVGTVPTYQDMSEQVCKDHMEGCLWHEKVNHHHAYLTRVISDLLMYAAAVYLLWL